MLPWMEASRASLCLQSPEEQTYLTMPFLINVKNWSMQA